jgi:hypothetical protein
LGIGEGGEGDKQKLNQAIPPPFLISAILTIRETFCWPPPPVTPAGMGVVERDIAGQKKKSLLTYLSF